MINKRLSMSLTPFYLVATETVSTSKTIMVAIATESAKSTISTVVVAMSSEVVVAKSTITTVVETMSSEVVVAESAMSIAVSVSIGVTVMSSHTQNGAGNTIVRGSSTSSSNMVGNGVDTELAGSVVPVYGSLMATGIINK